MSTKCAADFLWNTATSIWVSGLCIFVVQFFFTFFKTTIHAIKKILNKHKLKALILSILRHSIYFIVFILVGTSHIESFISQKKKKFATRKFVTVKMTNKPVKQLSEEWRLYHLELNGKWNITTRHSIRQVFPRAAIKVLFFF